MKIMISIPMRGRPDLEVREEYDVIAKKLTEEGHEVVDSWLGGIDAKRDLLNQCKCNVGLMYLGESLVVMSQCDAVYMAPGWENARGCKLECEAAKAYGLIVITAIQGIGTKAKEDKQDE